MPVDPSTIRGDRTNAASPDFDTDTTQLDAADWNALRTWAVEAHARLAALEGGDVTLSPSVGALTLAGLAPGVSNGAATTVQPTQGALALAGLAPTIDTGAGAGASSYSPIVSAAVAYNFLGDATDDSGNSRDGTLVSPGTLPGTHLDLGGAGGGVSIPAGFRIGNLTQWTILAVVRLPADPWANTQPAWFSEGDGTSNLTQIGLRDLSPTFRQQVKTDYDDAAINQTDTVNLSGVAREDWVAFAIRRDGASLTHIQDASGTKIETDTLSAATASSTTATGAKVGGKTDSSQPWDAIADLKVAIFAGWTSALTNGEIDTELAAMQAAVDARGLTPTSWGA